MGLQIGKKPYFEIIYSTGLEGKPPEGSFFPVKGGYFSIAFYFQFDINSPPQKGFTNFPPEAAKFFLNPVT